MMGRKLAMAVTLLALGLMVAGCGYGRKAQEERFFRACRNPAMIADVESMLRSDPTLANARDQDSRTPLHEAAVSGDVGAIDLLVTHGAKVNATDKHRATPLILAVLLNRLEAARRLVLAGANVNAATDCGETPLRLGILRHNLQMVQLLVQHGADVNRPWSADGETPLFLAERRKAGSIVSYLRQHGARERVPATSGKHRAN